MKQLLPLFTLLLLASMVYSQENNLRGIVTEQNSGDKTGKIEYVKGVEVVHPMTNKKDVSNDNGEFFMYLPEINYGEHTSLYAVPSGKYKDYMVVNEDALKKVVLSKDLVNIFISKADEWEKAKANSVNINLDNYISKQEYVRMQKRLQDELVKVQLGSTRWKEIADSLKFMADDISQMQTIIENYVDKLMRINLDFINESDVIEQNRKKAYKCAIHGELDSVFIYMKDTDLKLEEAIKQRDQAQKDAENYQKAADISNANAQIKAAQVSALIEDVMFMAQAAASQNKYQEAISYYEKAINADSLRMDNIFEYANYLYTIGEYDKAKNYYLRILTHRIDLHYETTIHNKLGNIYQYQQDYDVAQQHYQSCVYRWERLAEYQEDYALEGMANALNNLGNNYLYQNNYVEAEKLFLHSIEIHEALLERHPISVGFAMNLYGFGNLYMVQNNYVEAEKYFLRSLEIFDDELPYEYSPNLGTVLKKLGNNYHYQNNYSEAEKYYLRSLGNFEALAEENPKVYLPDLAEILNDIGNNYHSQNNYAEAEKYYLRCLEIREALIKEQPKVYFPDLATILNNLGNNYNSQKNYNEAEKYYLRCLEIYEALVEHNYRRSLEVREILAGAKLRYSSDYLPDLASSLYDIGNNYHCQQNYDEAEKYYRCCLKIRINLAQEQPKVYFSDLEMILNRLGNNYEYQNNYDDEEKCFLNCLGIKTTLLMKKMEDDLLDLVKILYKLGNICQYDKNYSEAETYFLCSIEIAELLSKEQSTLYFPYLANSLDGIGFSYFYQQNYVEAKKNYLYSLSVRETLAKDDPEVLGDLQFPLVYLEQLYSTMNEYSKAIYYCNTRIEILEKINADPRRILQSYRDLARYYLFTKEYSQSEQVMRHVLDLYGYSPIDEKDLTHALFFQNHLSKAKKTYWELLQSLRSSENVEPPYWILREDFDAFEKAGIITEEYKSDVEKIRKMLKD